MNNKDQKIVLEHRYNDFSFKKSKSNLNISFNRVAFIFFVFFLISIIYSIHLMHLGSRDSNSGIIKKSSEQLNNLYRADIVDVNNDYIGKTISSIDIGISPNKIIDEKKLLLNLKYIFPNKDFNEIKKRINKGKFFYLEKKISYENYEKLMKLGDKSIEPRDNLLRIYPQENLFSHIIGQIDDDNNGISGVEKSFDKNLKKNNLPLKLTLDTDIQYLIREELKKSEEIFQNLGSGAILMDINSGDIISLVSLPDFNLNKRESIKDLNYTNKITKGVYELGSVFKTLTLAAAFQNDVIEPETIFKKLEKKIFCDKYLIAEYDKELPPDLSAEQILIRSSNIGSVRIAQKVGIEDYSSFLKKIGVLEKISFDIDEVGKPINFRWGKCKLATASFGHGITTTPLQLAKAYAIISNGGYQIDPTLVFKTRNLSDKKKILKSEVSKKINPILRKVVSTKEGTAHFADVYGYEVGGKTGTADKVKKGVYTKNKINTFVSIFPISNPKFLLLVLLDEPKPSKDYIYHYRDGRPPYKGNWRNTAGWTTVLITGNIIENIGPILATKY